ncbi:MAG TPA: DNA translocase FtsK [Synergistaceae bacterium]|nr:DNA translocase FtsK [Synergistaceae bacterium]HPJ25073.1 DNA translocase FtsK [Synergistaceae bacterium]HPQ37257.1 DNA translocase FtsK [Synergistaceae bacterium]
MEEKNTQIRRKRRNTSPPEKKKSRDFSWLLPSRKLRKIVVLGILLMDIYLLSCIFPDLSGNLGRKVHGLLYRAYGFPMVLPLFHVAYQCLANLWGWHVENFRYQVLGTASLFFSCQLFFGLTELSHVVSWQPPFWPGTFSQEITLGLLRGVGLFGTFLLAMGGILFSLLCYGLSFSDRFHSLYAFVAALFQGLRKLFFRSKKNPEKNSSSEQDAADASSESSGAVSSSGEPLEEVRIIRRRSGDPSGEETPERELPGEPLQESPVAAVSEERVSENSLSGGQEETSVSQVPEAPPIRKQKPSEGAEKPYITSEDFSPESPPDDLEMFWEDPEEAEEEAFMLPVQVEPGRFPPPLELLGPDEDEDIQVETEELLEKGKKIVETLSTFGIEASLVETVAGPTVIQYRIQLAPGIKVSKVAGLSNDLAVSLAVSSLRIEAPIPGKPYIGIEIPNSSRKTVSLRSLIEDPGFLNTRSLLPLPMGVSIDGRGIVAHLEEMPHLLVAGTTGAGKSVFISNCLIGLSFLRRPEELRFLLIDPKRVEMTLYEKMPHLLAKPVVDPKKAVEAFAWAINEMERRYALFAAVRARDLKGYNKRKPLQERLPSIVIVVDELADLMMTSPKEVEDQICRLAQKARATGIHLILATQRPSVNVITGLIKANIPARVAFSLPTQADSRTVLDTGGAERLLGRGDCLHLTSRLPKPLRIQSGWIDESYIVGYIEYLSDLFGEPEYAEITGNSGGKSGSSGDMRMDDPLLSEAIELVMDTGIASASRLQRQLRIGFTRAARLVDYMEDLGIVGPQEGAKAREILLSKEEAEELMEQAEI